MDFFYRQWLFSFFYFNWYGKTLSIKTNLPKSLTQKALGQVVFLLGITVSFILAIPYSVYLGWRRMFTLAYNFAWMDVPENRLDFKKNMNMLQNCLAIPGYLLGLIVGLGGFLVVFSVRFNFENVVGFIDIIKLLSSAIFRTDDYFSSVWLNWRTKNSLIRYLSFPSLAIGMGVAVIVWQIRYSIENIGRSLISGYSLSYIDHMTYTKPKLNYKGILGLLLGTLSFALTWILVTSIRILMQTFLTILNALVQSCIDGRKWVTHINGLSSIQKFQIEQTHYEVYLGILGNLIYWPGLVFWACYGAIVDLLLYYFLINLTDVMNLIMSFIFEDLKLKNQSMTVVDKKNFFGVFGYIVGAILGVASLLVLGLIRALFEFIPEMIKGLRGVELWQDAQIGLFKKIISVVPFGLGLILRNTFLVLHSCLLLIVNTIYFDEHFPKMQANPLSLFEITTGCLGFLLSIPMFVLTCSLLIIYRLGYESGHSFNEALQPAFKLQPYFNFTRTLAAQYGYGGLGIGLAYGIAGLAGGIFYGGQMLILMFQKWWNMYERPRFELPTADVSLILQKIKDLYGALNNFSRVFPVEEHPILENKSGGKGTYCFIGKIMALNAPSIAEEYMDEVLSIYRKKQTLTKPDLDGLNLKFERRITNQEDCSILKKQELSLELLKTHNYVTGYIFN